MQESDQIICTIAIPTYNQLRFFARALQSALVQDVAGLEVIVVDDGSNAEAWASLQKLVPDGVRLLRNPKNLGLFANWNRCLQEARGRYFGILCSDDELAPGYLHAALATLERHEQISLVSTVGETRDASGRPVGRIGGFFAPGVYDGSKAIATLLDFYGRTGHNPFNYPSGVLVRTSTARAIRGFDESMQHLGDLDFFYRLMEHGHLAFLNTVGCYVTLHSGQAGSQRAAIPFGMTEAQQIIRRQSPDRISEQEKQRLATQYRALALWHALKFLRRLRFKPFQSYWRFARAGGDAIVALLGGVMSILGGKRQIQRQAASHIWQKQLVKIAD